MKPNQTFTLGNCQVIPIEYAIKFVGQEKQTLQPKFIEVLCYLAAHFPRVIPREELIENIWSGNSYVGEKALTNAIWHLRQKLKGINAEDEAIETIRKVGYRLLIQPEVLEDSQQNLLSKKTNTNKKNYQITVLIACALLVTLLFFQFNQQEPTIEQTTITQVTKYPGSELFSSPSPDGKSLVFKWQNNQTNSNLYLKDRNNPQLPPKQLTFGEDYVGQSVWSNDGQYLYFTRKNKSKNYCQVIRLKVLTNQEKPIVDCPTAGGYYYLDISPDDRTLAFHGYKAPADDNGIYFIDLLSKNSKPVRFSCHSQCGYRERDFAFSPDGKSIAVTRRINRFNENIYLIDIQTKEAVQLSQGEEDIVGLTWHPSGEKLVYAAQRADIRNGYILDIQSKQVSNLHLEGFSYPAFARQSKELFYQQRSEKYHLASLPLDSKVASSPFPVIESEFNHHYPHYSEQSNKIAYISNESGYYELWQADANGQNRQQLTFLKQTIRYPRWSHSGDKIAFLAPVEFDQADKIYIYHVKSKKLSIVPSNHQTHNRPTWAWDDQSIISGVYEKEYVDLHQINIESGQSTRISFDGSRYGMMISPTTLLYTREEKGLWQKEISLDEQDSTSSPLIKISGEDFKTTYSWHYTNQGVYFRQNFLKHHQFSYYDFKTQQTTALLRLPNNTLGSDTALSKIHATNKLLFTRADSPQADIKQIAHPQLK